MRKLLFANIGAAVACGVGAMGVTIAITHKVKSDKAQSNTIEGLNNVYKQIGSLYGANQELKQITDSNYNSLYQFIQESIKGTIASITTSQDKALALQRADLIEEIKKVQEALDNHSSFDDKSFSDVYTAIAGLNTRLEGISSIQSSFEEKLNTLIFNHQTSITQLWSSVDELQAKLGTISATVTGNYTELLGMIQTIQNKLLEVDQLKNMISSTEATVQEIIGRVDALKQAVFGNADYDSTALVDKLADLSKSVTALNTGIATIEGTVKTISQKVDVVFNDIEKLKSNQDITDAEVAQIISDLQAVKAEQGATSTAQDELLKGFKTISDNINALFVGNAQLQSQVDYLNTQNNLMYENFLYLQSLINDLQSNYGTGDSTTISIKPNSTDLINTLYDSTDSNANAPIVRFPSYNVTNLSRAKRFAIYIKVWTGSTPSYETQIIDAYPNYDLKMIGSSTQGLNGEQFLVSVGLDRNVNKININGLWSKRSSDAWKDIKELKNYKVQITNIVITY